MSTINIVLTDEQLNTLQQNIYSTISNAISQARKDSALEKRYLRKKEACEYLGISNNTLDKWIEQGFPRIVINRTLLFDKQAMNEWLAKHA